jgi:hypothetical protein
MSLRSARAPARDEEVRTDDRGEVAAEGSSD